MTEFRISELPILQLCPSFFVFIVRQRIQKEEEETVMQENVQVPNGLGDVLRKVMNQRKG